MDAGFEKRGVTLALLRAVRDEALRRDTTSGYWTIERLSALLVGNHEILMAENRWGVASGFEGDAIREAALTFKERCSLVEVLKRRHRHEPHPQLGLTYGQCVAPANVFVSFAYAADFVELVDALECQLESAESDGDESATFFWFDLFVNDQWQAANKSFDWWATTFKTAIQDIGKTVLVLLPWDKPVPLTRAWCLWEISCSSNLTVALSRAQQMAMEEDLLKDVDGIQAALSKIDLANADSYNPADKANIFRAVGTHEIHAFNSSILRMLRRWLVDSARRLLLNLGSEDGNSARHYHTMAQVADLLHVQGDLDAAATLFCAALEGQEALLLAEAEAEAPDRSIPRPPGPAQVAVLKTLHNYAGLLSDRGMLVEAAEMYQKALRAREELFGDTDHRTLETVNNLANLRWSQGRLGEAAELFVRALAGQTANP